MVRHVPSPRRYASADGGSIGANLLLRVEAAGVGCAGGAGDPFHRLAWHPTDPNVLVATTVDVFLLALDALGVSDAARAAAAPLGPPPPRAGAPPPPPASAAGGGAPRDKLAVPYVSVPRERLVGVKGHVGDVNDLAFSDNGSRLFTAAEDGYVVVWALEGESLEAASVMQPREGGSVESVVCLGSDDDGCVLVAVGLDANNEVCLLRYEDASEEDAMTELQSVSLARDAGVGTEDDGAMAGRVNLLARSPCGRYVFVASTARGALLAFHVGDGGGGGVAGRRIDYVCEFMTQHPIVSVCVTAAPGGGCNVFVVQTKAVQMYLMPAWAPPPRRAAGGGVGSPVAPARALPVAVHVQQAPAPAAAPAPAVTLAAPMGGLLSPSALLGSPSGGAVLGDAPGAAASSGGDDGGDGAGPAGGLLMPQAIMPAAAPLRQPPHARSTPTPPAAPAPPPAPGGDGGAPLDGDADTDGAAESEGGSAEDEGEGSDVDCSGAEEGGEGRRAREGAAAAAGAASDAASYSPAPQPGAGGGGGRVSPASLDDGDADESAQAVAPAVPRRRARRRRTAAAAAGAGGTCGGSGGGGGGDVAALAARIASLEALLASTVGARADAAADALFGRLEAAAGAREREERGHHAAAAAALQVRARMCMPPVCARPCDVGMCRTRPAAALQALPSRVSDALGARVCADIAAAAVAPLQVRARPRSCRYAFAYA